MPVLVVGTGRSGTNIILEILSGSSALKSPDGGVLRGSDLQKKLEVSQLSKVDIVNSNEKYFQNILKINPTIKLVWTIRDPRDICMSKIKRGVPRKKGGDCSGYSPDATPSGAIESLRLMVEIYKKFKDYPNSILIKMEDALLYTEQETKKLCKFLDINYEEDMLVFYKRMRNKHKRKRYSNIDLSQIAMWKNWQSAYDGYLLKKNIDMNKIFVEVEDLITYFGYCEV